MKPVYSKADWINDIVATEAASRAVVTKVLQAAIDTLRLRLEGLQSAQIVGLGSIALGIRPGRIGRDPRTGSPLTLPPGVRVAFRPCKALKEAWKVADLTSL